MFVLWWGVALASPSVAVGSGNRPAVEVLAYREATRVPWAVHLGRPLHPGLDGGVRWPVAGGPRLRADVTARLGAFAHRLLTVAGTADLGLALQGTWRSGPTIGAEVGVGALLGRSPAREHVADGRGGFEVRSGRWRPGARIALSVDGGIRIGAAGRPRPRLLLRVRHWVEAPFSPGFIPVMVHRDVGLVLQAPLAKRRST